MPEILIYDVLHTPLAPGRPSGALYEVQPLQLIVQLLQKILDGKNELAGAIRGFHLATTHPVHSQGGNLARTALLSAGLSAHTSGYGFFGTEECGWGAFHTAIATLNQEAPAGFFLTGGTDSYSRLGTLLPENPWEVDLTQLNSGKALPFSLSADLLATRFSFQRSQLDEIAYRSAVKATSISGKKIHAQRLVPICDPNGLPIASRHDLPDSPLEPESYYSAVPVNQSDEQPGMDLLALQHFPEMESIRHDHTNLTLARAVDASALLLLGRAGTEFEKLAGPPVARILTLAACGSPVEDPFAAAVLSARQVLAQSGLEQGDIDTWAFFENCSASALRFRESLQIPEEKFNEAGGELFLGKAGGASTGLLISRLLSTMEVKKRRRGLAAICGASGEGGACILERIS